MTRLRIRAKAPPLPPDPAILDYPAIRLNGLVPSWQDVEVLLVDDDGRETMIDCVQRVEIDIKASSEPLTATLHVIGVELDVDARIDTVIDAMKAAAGEDGHTVKR